MDEKLALKSYAGGTQAKPITVLSDEQRETVKTEMRVILDGKVMSAFELVHHTVHVARVRHEILLQPGHVHALIEEMRDEFAPGYGGRVKETAPKEL